MAGKTFVIGFAVVAAWAASALDNTLVDGYWDTTGYVNATVSVAASATATVFDSRVEGSGSGAIARFTSHPAATMILIR